MSFKEIKFFRNIKPVNMFGIIYIIYITSMMMKFPRRLKVKLTEMT